MKHVCIFLVCLSLLIPAALSAQTLVDRIVAVVDKEIITESELDGTRYFPCGTKPYRSEPSRSAQASTRWVGIGKARSGTVID